MYTSISPSATLIPNYSQHHISNSIDVNIVEVALRQISLVLQQLTTEKRQQICEKQSENNKTGYFFQITVFFCLLTPVEKLSVQFCCVLYPVGTSLKQIKLPCQYSHCIQTKVRECIHLSAPYRTIDERLCLKSQCSSTVHSL